MRTRRRERPTLAGRLTAALVVLVLVVAAVTGVATVIVVRTALLSQLDTQLVGAGGRYSAEIDGRPDGDGDDDGGASSGSSAFPRRDHGGGARPGAGVGEGQSVGTLGVLLRSGGVLEASVVAPDGDVAHVDVDGGSLAALAALPAGGPPRSVDLGTLGDYRVRVIADDGLVQVTGLPLAPVGAVLRRVVVAELLLGLFAAAVSGAVTSVVVRRGLRPLGHVAATAQSITELPLAGSAEGLPGPVTSAGSTREVHRLSSAVDAMVEHVRAALLVRDREEERRRRFMADASHELRTPLAVVQAHVEQALRSGDPDRVRASLERMGVASERMAHLVDDLLLLAHLDAGRPLGREQVPLSLLVLEDLVDARAAGPDHAWSADLPEEPIDVPGDRQRLHQVLTGLLSNARLHTPAGTSVLVTARGVDVDGRAWARLEVSDDGPGIPEHLRGSVFDRFTRADDARSGGGSGLGLAIARGIARAHGGDLLLVDAPRGATFRLLLPLVEETDGSHHETAGSHGVRPNSRF
ncbi:two-component system, OmpR family, sensor kinase [Quadrisphaera granulorum]|uniref:histidine kinase n=1 Tax=Quadrisphaera granulorum TaxID=317664 RepID=A0A315ZTI2_9ACTN|nr:HAMP domain-containing sensor histidine kinase [Quadrisphaera granulorum]PWJ48855.1 two-component system OmpR family sensor kinase [Quadrisphaera granulorum]SZE98337.1 two-component system, OmpR family, sensor kinase [Quadrisphaera granulorum]